MSTSNPEEPGQLQSKIVIFTDPAEVSEASEVGAPEHPLTPPTKEQIEQLGGKGANLVEIKKAGLPTPPGLVLSTELGPEVVGQPTLPNKIKQLIEQGLAELEAATNLEFGHKERPLLVSVRSGAAVSMPGMMDTILNVGLTDATMTGLADAIGKTGAWSSYAQLIELYGSSVANINPDAFAELKDKIVAEAGVDSTAELDFAYWQKLVARFKQLYLDETGQPFPQDPHQQLQQAVWAVFNSWMSPAAINYRNMEGITDGHTGTAVTIQQMVFGNAKGQAGSGVIISRNPTLNNGLGGHFQAGAQGQAIVSGSETGALDASKLPAEIKKQLEPLLPKLEQLVGGVADIEITWQGGQLYILQVRQAKLPPPSAVTYAARLSQEGVLDPEQALDNIRLRQIQALTSPQFTAEAINNAEPLLSGFSTSGVGQGQAYFSVPAAREALEHDQPVVLIVSHLDPNDVDIIKQLEGLVTTRGTPSSHIALIMQKYGIATVMGCSGVELKEAGAVITKPGQPPQELNQGDQLSVDGSGGKVYAGQLEQRPAQFSQLPQEVRQFVEQWQQRFGVNNPWAEFVADSAELAKNQTTVKQLLAKIRQEVAGAKAQDTQFVTEFLPGAIPTYCVKVNRDNLAEAKAEIKQLVEQAADQGYSVWPRSSYQHKQDGSDLFQDAPYTSQDLTQKDEDGQLANLRDWLENPDSQVSHSGGLEGWLTQGEADKFELASVIVQFDPKDKLKKSVRNEHFVASARCEQDGTIVVDVNDGECHVRTLANVAPAELMQIVVKPNPTSRGQLGAISYRFGLDHFNPAELEQLSFKPDDGYLEVTEEQLRTLEDHPFKQRSLAVLKQLRDKIFTDWWQQGLAAKMWAMAEVTGNDQLELQGRWLDEPPEASSGQNWIKVYGVKGGAEGE